MSTKSHAYMRCGTLRKLSTSTRGYAEIHIQRPFLENKIAYFGQFWAKFAALTVVESMPKARLKSLKLSNSSTMIPDTTWSGLLESYHPYLTPQKVSKNPQTYCIHNTLSKSAKSHFGCLRPLGVIHSMCHPIEQTSHKVIVTTLLVYHTIHTSA
jgi:hypothetical protein